MDEKTENCTDGNEKGGSCIATVVTANVTGNYLGVEQVHSIHIIFDHTACVGVSSVQLAASNCCDHLSWNRSVWHVLNTTDFQINQSDKCLLRTFLSNDFLADQTLSRIVILGREVGDRD